MVSPSHNPAPPSPSTPTENPAALATALQELGFEPIRTENYEWLYSFPDARALLTAVATEFRSENVLSEDEANRYAHLKRTQPLLPEPQRSKAAAPLFSGLLRNSLSDDQAEELLAEEEYLSHLHLQLRMLTDVIDAEKEHSDKLYSDSASPSNTEEHPLPDFDDPSHPVNQLRRNADQLELLFLRNSTSSPSRPESSHLSTYIDAENRELQEIENARLDALQLTSLHQRSAPENDETLKMTVESYADIKRNHALADVELARHAAVLNSLSETHTKYLEVTPASLEPLIADTHRRSTAAVAVHLDEIKDAAARELWDDIHAGSLDRDVVDLDRYIEVLRTCVTALVEQRLRLLCIEKAVELETEDRENLLALLAAVAEGDEGERTDAVAPADTVNGANLSSSFGQLSLGGQDEDLHNLNNWDCLTIDMLEEGIFQTAVDDANNILSEFRSKVGCESDWLDLHENPGVTAALQRLESELASNTVVLETLLRNRSKILEGAGSTHSGDWARRILEEGGKGR